MTTGFAARPNRIRQRRNPSVAGVGAAAEKPDTTPAPSVEDTTSINADEDLDTDGAEDSAEGTQGDTCTKDVDLDSGTSESPDESDTEPEDTSEPQDEPEPIPAKPAKAKTARKATKETPTKARALVVIGDDGSVRADAAAHVLDFRDLNADAEADELLDALKSLSGAADSEVRDGAAGLLMDMIRVAALGG